MEEFQKEIRNLKEIAKEWSVYDGKMCWERFPSKRKTQYNECAKESVISYHVFCQGKREIYEAKREKLARCKGLFDPNEAYTCRSEVYKEMLPHIQSLQSWMGKEREDFLKSLI